MDLVLLFQDCTLVMPAGLPGFEFALSDGADPSEHGIGSSLVLDVPEVQVQIRLHDYFMGASLPLKVPSCLTFINTIFVLKKCP